MSTIVFLPGVPPIIGSRQGLTFDRSQAGPYVKKRPSPCNPTTNNRERLWGILRECNAYFWNLTSGQKTAWATWAATNGITGPYGQTKHQQGYAGFFTVQVNAQIAGDPFYIVPPGNLPLGGVTFTALSRIDNNTIRATFNPSPAGATNRIYLRQSLPGPGVRRWSAADGYICPYSPLDPTSPPTPTHPTHHLSNWHGRYWTGTQESTGRRSTETLWDL